MKKIQKAAENTLVMNSFYQIASSILHTGVGFIFLILVARIYSPQSIGESSTLIGSLGIILTLSILGLDDSLIKYFLKEDDREKALGTAFIIVTMTCLLFSLVILSVMSLSVPEILLFLRNPESVILYLLSTLAWVYFSIIESVYLTLNKGKYILAKNIIFNALKLIFPFLLLPLGYFGIFLSWTIPAFLSFGFTFIISRVQLRLSFDKSFLKRIFRFTSVNYFANALFWLRGFIIPLLVAKFVSTQSAAIYFIAFNLMNIFYIFPKSIGRALFAEYARDKIHKHAGKLILFSTGLSFAAAAFIFIFGDLIMGLLGAAFSSAGLLRLLSVSGIFICINEILLSDAKHRSDSAEIFAVRGLSSIIVICSSFVLIMKIGLIGVGLAYIIGESLVTIFILIRRKANA